MQSVVTDKPFSFPEYQVDGSPLKPITRLLLERRATAHFKSDPVPDEYLDAILQFGLQSPSGFNLQPWRFLVVRDRTHRQRLQKAAMDQAKVGEAPVVIIAFATADDWQEYIDAIFQEGVRRGVGKAGELQNAKQMAANFLGQFPEDVWMNRHTMIAFTTMMLVAEAYGLDTAPMEGFDPEAIKREFKLPLESFVIALLAIGHAKEPDKSYGGRLAVEEIVHSEEFGHPYKVKDGAELSGSQRIFREISSKEKENLKQG